jgi:isopentenyl diphosphate isomerase/L-lactate dehydrogenase-like FMN-dependent dehydrogenase
VTVESYRIPAEEAAAAGEFADWGTSTALLLAALGPGRKGILASGGIRSGMDAAKALAMGAELVGLALPVIRAVVLDGEEGVVRLFQRMEKTLRTVMMLTGSRTVEDLRRGTILSDGSLRDAAASLRAAGMPGAGAV